MTSLLVDDLAAALNAPRLLSDEEIMARTREVMAAKGYPDAMTCTSDILIRHIQEYCREKGIALFPLPGPGE